MGVLSSRTLLYQSTSAERGPHQVSGDPLRERQAHSYSSGHNPYQVQVGRKRGTGYKYKYLTLKGVYSQLVYLCIFMHPVTLMTVRRGDKRLCVVSQLRKATSRSYID